MLVGCLVATIILFGSAVRWSGAVGRWWSADAGGDDSQQAVIS